MPPKQIRGRRGNNNRQRNRTANRASKTAYTRFLGNEPALQGHIYDAGHDSNQYIETTWMIVEFVGCSFKRYTSELRQGVLDLQLDDPVPTADPDDPNNPLSVKRWEIELKQNSEKTRLFQDFRAWLYSVVIGQCSKALKGQIRSHRDYKNAQNDDIALLIIIKSLTHSFEPGSKKLVHSLVDLKQQFLSFRQGRYMALQTYHDKFMAQAEVLDEVEATIADQALVTEIAGNNGRRDASNDDDRNAAKQQTLAMIFIKNSNKEYQDYKDHLESSYLDGHDVYPTTVQAAYLVLRQRPRWDPEAGANVAGAGVAFATSGHETSGDPNDGATQSTMRRNLDHITCHNCNQRGHYANQCPNRNQNQGSQGQNAERRGTVQHSSNVRWSFAQGGVTQRIPSSWILPDNESTINLFHNADLLTNIRVVDRSLEVHCNDGSRHTNQMGDLPGFGPVWYHPDCIANILSLIKVMERFDVIFDSRDDNAFIVVKPDGNTVHFQQPQSGLFYLDIAANPNDATSVLLVNTVAENKNNYTNEDYLRAKRACETQIKIGRPSTKDFTRIVSNNFLPNFPVTADDIRAADDIFGPDIGYLKGKTTRRSPRPVQDAIATLPRQITERYREITLCSDIMFVNEVPFLITILRNIRFGTAEELIKQKVDTIFAAIRQVYHIYRQRGFRAHLLLADGQYTSLCARLADIRMTLNEVAEDEHVGEAERYIRTVKERARCVYNMLPFNKLPRRMIVELMYFAVYWLNSFPHMLGVSQSLSPREIVTRRRIDFNRHCRYEYGEYVRTHESHDNSISPRTVGAIALRPTGNNQGNYYFLSLSSG